MPEFICRVPSFLRESEHRRVFWLVTYTYTVGVENVRIDMCKMIVDSV
jgi:hypothetical protein